MYLFRINKKSSAPSLWFKKKKTTRLRHVYVFDFLLFYFSDDVCMYMTISECVCMCVSD